MLFYERDGIDIKAYLPKIREPSVSSAESANSEATTGERMTNGGVSLSTGAGINGDDEDPKKCAIM